MERKNILVGKIGKAIKFKNIHIEKGGGTDFVLYSTLARINPEFHFYLGGPNDLNKLSEEEYNYIFPNHNVHSIFCKDKEDPRLYSAIIKKMNDENIKLDFALLFNGVCSTHNIPNFMTYPGTTKHYTPLQSFRNYAAPYIYILNQTQIPLYLISEDARYVSVQAHDLYDRERLIFSQCNTHMKTFMHITNDNDFTFVPANEVDCLYACVERIFLMGLATDWRDRIDFDAKLNSPVKDHLIVLSNGCGTKGFNTPTGSNMSRLPVYKEWIFEGLKGSPYEGTPVYGSWDKKAYAEYPTQIINKLIVNLGSEIRAARYGFVYSMVPGFVTTKPWELIIMGIIPFMHPDYDKDNLLGLPEYTYCKDVDDFKKKMMELDANPELYKKVLNECLDKIKPEFLDGSFINNFFFTHIAKDMNFDYYPRKGVKSIFDRFSSDMLNHSLINK